MKVEEVQEIMSDRMIGIREVAGLFTGVEYPSAAFRDVHYAPDVLRSAAQDPSCVLIPDPGISIMQQYHATAGGKEGFVRFFFHGPWYAHQLFASEVDRPGWRLVRVEPVEGSLGCSEEDAVRLLGDAEEVPHAREVTLAAIVRRAARGIRSLEHAMVRTSCVDAAGRIVRVGKFGRRVADNCPSTGVLICTLKKAVRDPQTGLAACARRIKRGMR